MPACHRADHVLWVYLIPRPSLVGATAEAILEAEGVIRDPSSAAHFLVTLPPGSQVGIIHLYICTNAVMHESSRRHQQCAHWIRAKRCGRGYRRRRKATTRRRRVWILWCRCCLWGCGRYELRRHGRRLYQKAHKNTFYVYTARISQPLSHVDQVYMYTTCT